MLTPYNKARSVSGRQKLRKNAMDVVCVNASVCKSVCV